VWNEIINKTYGRGLQIVHVDVAEKFGLVAPIGISFYTLEAIGYLIDVSRGKYPAEKSFWRFAAFLSFFPNIMSGPIERGDHFLGQLREITKKKRRELLNYDRVMQGLIAMLLGYGMKLIVAQRAEILVNQVYSMYQDANSFTMLIAALFYAVQIYCHFASYSKIAVGVGRLFGFELVQNFKQPYFAKNLTDFWRRWHISLSSWLRDYIYIPLGGGRKDLQSDSAIYCLFFSSAVCGMAARRSFWHGLLHGAGQVVRFLQKGEASGIREAKLAWKSCGICFRFC
ncbi:MAG: MBOAT family O-acyltransferase, partial [Gallintestinimicrobium sp.]